MEHEDDKIYSTAGRGETFAEILARRVSRRGMLKGGTVASALVLSGPVLGRAAYAQGTPPALATPAVGAKLAFEPIALDTGDEMVVPAGYRATPLLKWGDPLFADAPEFDPENQTAAAQAMQVGYNCDWIGFLPLEQGSDSSDHGLLVVNHEYTIGELMFPGYASQGPPEEGSEEPTLVRNPTKELVDVELEAHGLSVVEIRRANGGAWEVVRDSEYNRRITATTEMEITGPAAGAALLKTSVDQDGTRVIGTLNNCAGGVTPWGTIVTGEENFQQYFGNLVALAEDDPVRVIHDRYGVEEETTDRRWEEFYDRFDVAMEPNEPFRFGWGVEIDPYDPQSIPKKRTALGRNKHEGHTSVVAPGGQVAVYSGDDERFEYAYKFVTEGTYNPDDRTANMDLLDAGTLYVARFNDDGGGEWLPLVHGENGLDEAAGFTSQADILINTRAAGDILGATKMDRPEDFETNPVNKKVYLALTNNNRRTLEETDRANPRPENLHGHIIEITEAGDDHAATTFGWEMFILCGDPAQGSTYFAGFDTGEVSPLSAPDNVAFDLEGNLWISTDGMPRNLPGNDGLFAVPVEGEERGFVRQFFSSVPGAEVTGPVFTPDNTSLFVAVQHPGEGSDAIYNSVYEEPGSRWPDGVGPPRPSVVVIQADDSTARIGTSRA
jgi:secreted PhoX family phosphatase